jgi:hypothetical protein
MESEGVKSPRTVPPASSLGEWAPRRVVSSNMVESTQDSS